MLRHPRPATLRRGFGESSAVDAGRSEARPVWTAWLDGLIQQYSPRASLARRPDTNARSESAGWLAKAIAEEIRRHRPGQDGLRLEAPDVLAFFRMRASPMGCDLLRTRPRRELPGIVNESRAAALPCTRPTDRKRRGGARRP